MSFKVNFPPRTRKITLEPFLTSANRTKFQNMEIQKSREKASKVAIIYINDIKTWPFLRYLLEMLFTYTPHSVLSHVFRLVKFEKKILKVSENIIFCWLFSKFSYFKYFENPRQRFDRHLQSPSSVENQSVLSINPFAWQRFPKTFIFYLKREKHWR